MLCGAVLRVPIISYVCMARMFSCHEHATARRADCLPRIVLGEFNPFFGEPINVWCFDPFLSKASELIIAQIIGKDKDDIRFACEAVKST